MNFLVNHNGHMRIAVYNLLGQQVAELYNGMQNKGDYDVTFDASMLSSGIYFINLNSNTNTITKKLLLLK